MIRKFPEQLIQTAREFLSQPECPEPASPEETLGQNCKRLLARQPAWLDAHPERREQLTAALDAEIGLLRRQGKHGQALTSASVWARLRIAELDSESEQND